MLPSGRGMMAHGVKLMMISWLIDIVFRKRYVGPMHEGYALLGVNGLTNLGQYIKIVGFLFYPFWRGDMNAVLHLPKLIEIIGFDSHMDRSLSISLFLSCRLSLIEELTASRRKYNSP